MSGQDGLYTRRPKIIVRRGQWSREVLFQALAMIHQYAILICVFPPHAPELRARDAAQPEVHELPPQLMFRQQVRLIHFSNDLRNFTKFLINFRISARILSIHKSYPVPLVKNYPVPLVKNYQIPLVVKLKMIRPKTELLNRTGSSPGAFQLREFSFNKEAVSAK